MCTCIYENYTYSWYWYVYALKSYAERRMGQYGSSEKGATHYLLYIFFSEKKCEVPFILRKEHYLKGPLDTS